MNRENKYKSWEQYKPHNEGIVWPKGQALPSFSTPEELDTFTITYLSNSMRSMLTVMQGIVNRKKTRVFLNGMKALEEGADQWPKVLGLNRKEDTSNIFEFIKRYQSEFKGIILYNAEGNRHLLNLVGTIAGIKNAIPVDSNYHSEFIKNGIDLPIVEDFRKPKFKNHLEMYEYLYENYWKDCTKRVLASMDPIDHHAFIRDMAAAVGAAVVWLDPRKEKEAELLDKFLDDMKAGESIILGWWPEERSGIGAGTKHGISTIPSDYYENSTVYAGMDHIIKMPVVPKKPELENKIYIAVFLSDGDNVQYCQHRMSVLWEEGTRGTIPINWTVSPGLVDVGPGILNYFYKTATENDFLCSGPSGLGYALIYDSHNEKYFLQDKERANAYAEFSEQYLAKSGIRVITIWDLLKDIHFNAYATHCRTLYGLTLEDWFQKPAPVEIHIEQNKLTFAPNYPAYAEACDDIYSHMEKKVAAFDGQKPLFLCGQGVSWSMTAENLTQLKKRFEELQPGKIEFVRADHFFALHNEANGVPFNLALSNKVKVSSSDESGDPSKTINGSPSGDNIWVSENENAWLLYDLGGEYELTRYTLKNAGFDGMDPSLNTRDLKLEVSMDGVNWTLADEYTGNEKSVIDIDIEPVKAKFAKLSIINPGADKVTRVADFELYGISK